MEDETVLINFFKEVLQTKKPSSAHNSLKRSSSVRSHFRRSFLTEFLQGHMEALHHPEEYVTIEVALRQVEDTFRKIYEDAPEESVELFMTHFAHDVNFVIKPDKVPTRVVVGEDAKLYYINDITVLASYNIHIKIHMNHNEENTCQIRIKVSKKKSWFRRLWGRLTKRS